MKQRCPSCLQYLPASSFSGVFTCACDVCAVAAKSAAVPAAGTATAESGLPLPCLNSNNSTCKVNPVDFPAFHRACNEVSSLNEYSTSFMKSATALEMNIHSFVNHFGVDYCGFLTLTFPDNVIDVREASRRFNSMNTHFLREISLGYIGVYERHKSGRIHFHLLVAFDSNIRGGLDFSAVAKRDYRTANKSLRSLWALMRRRLPDYGFGRAELLPVKTNAKGIARYVAKYIGKAVSNRVAADKGFRLVRSSMDKAQAWKVATSCFAFVSSGSRKWRYALRSWVAAKADYLKQVAYSRGIIVSSVNEHNYSDVLSRFVGSKWAFLNFDEIASFNYESMAA